MELLLQSLIHAGRAGEKAVRWQCAVHTHGHRRETAAGLCMEQTMVVLVSGSQD